MKTKLPVLLLMIPAIALAQSDGTLDLTFESGSGFSGNGFPLIEKVLIQPDQRILVGGSFTAYNGITRNGIARLKPNGAPDFFFGAGDGFDGTVMDLALQPDGKIIAVGDFISYAGHSINGIVRLLANGVIDTTFHSNFGSETEIKAVALQNDGKILVGGVFQSGVVRLNPDGTLDSDFDANSHESGYVYDIVVQPDGKILAGGSFSQPGGKEVIRCNEDGSLDESFDAYPNLSICLCLALSSDGSILAGCTEMAGLVRLNSDGSLLNSVESFGDTFYSYIKDVFVQEDDKVVYTGYLMDMLEGNYNHAIKRKTLNGLYDGTFQVMGWPGRIQSVARQSDGKLIVAGDFDGNGSPPNGSIARLNSSVTGIDNYESIHPGVYPNPSNGIFWLEVEGPTEITLVNSIGQILIHQTFWKSGNLDLTDSPDGIYLLHIVSGRGTSSTKLVKL